MKDYLTFLKLGQKGIVIACVIGLISVIIKYLTALSILDPLVVSLLLGIVIRSFINFDKRAVASLKLAPSLFIPVGVIFYGAVNLNFPKFAAVDSDYIFLLLIVVIVYIISVLVLSRFLGINEKIGYLIAVGSAICGASAIAITSKAIDAEPDDVSNSVIPLFITALIGLFLVFPFLAIILKISPLDYGIFSGAVMQFTGFVKILVSGYAEPVRTLALTIKATRYIALLLIIPLFASFLRGKFYIPWFLWAFLGAGLLFSFTPGLAHMLRPTLKFVLTLLWSIAMGAIGLNASLKTLLTKNSLKAFVVSFASFILATCIFLLGITFL